MIRHGPVRNDRSLMMMRMTIVCSNFEKVKGEKRKTDRHPTPGGLRSGVQIRGLTNIHTRNHRSGLVSSHGGPQDLDSVDML